MSTTPIISSTTQIITTTIIDFKLFDCYNENERTFQSFALKMKPYLYPGIIIYLWIIKLIKKLFKFSID